MTHRKYESYQFIFDVLDKILWEKPIISIEGLTWWGKDLNIFGFTTIELFVTKSNKLRQNNSNYSLMFVLREREKEGNGTRMEL